MFSNATEFEMWAPQYCVRCRFAVEGELCDEAVGVLYGEDPPKFLRRIPTSPANLVGVECTRIETAAVSHLAWERRIGRMRRAICPACQREVAVYRPTRRRGPGVSGDVYRAHRDRAGDPCVPGSGKAVAPTAYVVKP